MMTALYLADGAQTTKEDIRKAIAEHRAVLRWSHGNWCNQASLLILDTEDEANIEAERDTIDECYAMSDEIWSERPISLGQAMRAAAGALRTS